MNLKEALARIETLEAKVRLLESRSVQRVDHYHHQVAPPLMQQLQQQFDRYKPPQNIPYPPNRWEPMCAMGDGTLHQGYQGQAT